MTFFALALAWALGFAVVAFLTRARDGLLFRGSLGLGLGLGLTSVGHFAGLALGGPSPRALLGTELAALALLGGLAFARRGASRDGAGPAPGDAPPGHGSAPPGHGDAPPGHGEAPPGHGEAPLASGDAPLAGGDASLAGHLSPRGERLLGWAFALVALGALAVYVAEALGHPEGGWDAWMIWNLRARFLFRGGEAWRSALSPALAWSHPDYPLGLPAAVARLWTLAGEESRLAPALVAGAFTLAVAGLLVSAVARERGRAQGLVAGIVLLGTDYFLVRGASQLADVPVSFFALATFVLLGDGPAGRDRSCCLAGLAAALAAWTKNEGFLFLVVVPLAQLGGGARRDTARRLLAFGLGALPVLAATLLFKVAYAPPNDLVSGQGARTVDRIADLSRYGTILRVFFVRVFRFPVAGLLAYALLVGPAPLLRTAGSGRRGLLVLAATLALMLVGFFAVYVTTPLDLAWHLATSLQRLLMQLWPAGLYVFFLAVRTPEEALAPPLGGRASVPG